MIKITLEEVRNLNRPMYISNGHAPAESKCEGNPELREAFYTDLTSLINTVCKRAMPMVMENFNAKT